MPVVKDNCARLMFSCLLVWIPCFLKRHPNAVNTNSPVSPSMALCDKCVSFLKELGRRSRSKYEDLGRLQRTSVFEHYSNSRDLLRSATNQEHWAERAEAKTRWVC